eukprot:16428-Prymnesium_polylepis.2
MSVATARRSAATRLMARKGTPRPSRSTRSKPAACIACSPPSTPCTCARNDGSHMQTERCCASAGLSCTRLR